jgi:hypothetical protein
MLITDFPRQIALLTSLGLWSLTGCASNAQQLCPIDAPRYRLQDDTVSWSMTIVNDHSCVHGVRFGNILLDSLKLSSPPRFGEVALQGWGFKYSPNAGFHGQDTFSLTVVGALRGTRGSSTIEVNVSVGPGQKNRITCTGILIELDMNAEADFPMAVVYDNAESPSHTCILDLGHAGHWPLKGACYPGEKCVLSGPYFKKIGNTYYMREWDKAESPDHPQ